MDNGQIKIEKERYKTLGQILAFIFLIILTTIILDKFSIIKINERYNAILTVTGALCGLMSFLSNTNKIEKNLQEEYHQSEFTKKSWARYSFSWVKKEGKLYVLAVIILIVTAISLRIYKLGKLSLWWDEIITGTVVKRIIETGLPLQPSGSTYYWRGIFYHYLVSGFSIFSPDSEFLLRLPSVICGIGIILGSYYLARKIDKTTAILTLIFLVFSTYNLEYSRFARFYILNAFLFIIAIIYFYKGFFLQESKSKWISLIILALMMQTVQLGGIYIFIIATYVLAEALDLTAKPKIRFWKKDYWFILTSLIIIGIGNIFERIQFIYNLIANKNIYAYQILENIAKPAEYPLIKWPEWVMVIFYQNNHIPLILAFSILPFMAYVFYKEIKKNKIPSIGSYLAVITIFSTIIFEIINRDVEGARIFLFLEPLYVIISIFCLVSMCNIALKNLKISKIISFIIVAIFIFSIHPMFYERLSIDYGKNIEQDQFRSTHVASYRSDYKTPYLYLKNKLSEGDIWINIMYPNYFYYQNSPDYILNQNYRWNTLSWINENGEFITPDTNSILINSAKDIKRIIEENSDKKIWILINGGSINILNTTHVRKDVKDFIKDNGDKIVYRSEDGYSEILSFN